MDRQKMDELKKLVLTDGRHVNWETIRERFFEKLGSRWIPKKKWQLSDNRRRCDPRSSYSHC